MLEPFAAEPDLSLYVARPASERAVAAVVSALRDPRGGLTVLYGPPGIGKSIVLERIADQLGSECGVLRIDHQGLTYLDICAWFARELESLELESPSRLSWSQRLREIWSSSDSDSRDPEANLIALISRRAQRGEPIRALIDEADEMDSALIRSLEALAQRSDGAFSICVATSDDDTCDQLPPSIEVVRFEEPMTEAETQSYIESRLARAQAPGELVRQLGPERIRRLHRFSGGNPRRLHAELSLIRIASSGPGSPGSSTPAAAIEGEEPILEPEAIVDVEPEATAQSLSPVAEAAAPRVRASSDAPAPAAASPDPRLSGSHGEDPGPAPTVSFEPPESAASSQAPPGSRTPGDSSELPRFSIPVRTLRRQRRTAQGSGSSPPNLWKPVGFGAGAATLAATLWLLSGPSPSSEDARPEAAAPSSENADAPVADREAQGESRTSPRNSGQRTAGTERSPRLPTTDDPGPRTESIPIPVNINADPWATIWVDGREIGETPLGDVPLAPGSHRFKAQLPDGRIVEQTIEISPARRWVFFD